MNAILAALAPVGLIIALGWFLRRSHVPGDGFWAPAETLTYYLLFPALIVGSLGRARFTGFDVAPMALALAAALLTSAATIRLLRRSLAADGPAFSSLFQGSIRLNTYIGLAGAAALYGDAGLSLAAVAVATHVPIVNVLSVVVLSRHAGATKATWRGVVGMVARNPLIIACAVGLALNLSGLGLPPGLAGAFDILGRAALALGLLCVGAGLSFAGLRRVGRGIAAVCTVKLIVMPLAAAAACRLLDVDASSAGVAILFAALPTATSSYILARQMGGDSPLMAQVVAVTHLVAAISLPLVLGIFTG